MSESTELWDSILTLATADKLDLGTVEGAIGADLLPDVAESGESSDVYRFREPAEDSAFSEVELRVPKGGATAKGPLAILRLRESDHPRLPAAAGERDMDFVLAKMNRSPRVLPPDPRQRVGALVYHEYEIRSGKLRFGFSDDEARILRAIVIDRS